MTKKASPFVSGPSGGGGGYDELTSRFTGQPVPATGFSIGVSRLGSCSASTMLGKLDTKLALSALLLLRVLAWREIADYQKMVVPSPQREYSRQAAIR